MNTSGKLVAEFRVRSCDVDAFGHVNNSVYLNYLEAARNEYMLQKGVRFADIWQWNAAPILLSAHLDYKLPARTDDDLVITGEIELIGRVRFRIRHEVLLKKDQRLACGADLHFAFVDLQHGKPVRIPEPFSKAFGLHEAE